MQLSFLLINRLNSFMNVINRYMISKICITVFLIYSITLNSQEIKSVWFTESGQMVCKMCPGKSNYQLNYVGSNCNKWEVVAVMHGSYNIQYVKLLNRTIDNSNQVQQVVTIDSGFAIIDAVKFKKKGSSQTYTYNLNSKGTPPVFVGYQCQN